MGRRDMVKREVRKPKKDVKKKVVEMTIIQPPPPPVEVVKRGKKAKGENWEE
jgi:hypothetical protein